MVVAKRKFGLDNALRDRAVTAGVDRVMAATFWGRSFAGQVAKVFALEMRGIKRDRSPSPSR